MILWLRDYLTTPSGFPRRPWAYAANQIGHILVGALVAHLTGNWLAAVAIYCLLIEAPQLALWGGDWSDGIEDTAHASAGALAIAAGWPALIVSGLIIAAGIAWRIEERGGLAAAQRRR